MPTTLIAADLTGRRAAALANPAAVPSSTDRDQSFKAQLRSTIVERDGKKFYQFDGHASVVDQSYTMYDFFGPYDEKVDSGAFDKTLGSGPDVAFLLNHRGMTMARTKVSNTLQLGVDDIGLAVTALCNPERGDVRDLALAVEDGDVDQMSFAFVIVRGQWSPDYTEYTILEADLDRGDVSAVNYGANPYTSISARARQAFDAIDGLEGPALRAVIAAAAARQAQTAPAATAPSVGTLRARLELEN